jgi:hypothetical protein
MRSKRKRGSASRRPSSSPWRRPRALEYEAVILYDLISLERARFREVTEGMTRETLEVESLVYSLEDWQKEARRLDLQGKPEQADGPGLSSELPEPREI